MILVNVKKESDFLTEQWTVLCFTCKKGKTYKMRIMPEFYIKKERVNLNGEFVETLRKECSQRIPPMSADLERQAKEMICAQIMKLEIK